MRLRKAGGGITLYQTIYFSITRCTSIVRLPSTGQNMKPTFLCLWWKWAAAPTRQDGWCAGSDHRPRYWTFICKVQNKHYWAPCGYSYQTECKGGILCCFDKLRRCRALQYCNSPKVQQSIHQHWQSIESNHRFLHCTCERGVLF